MCGVSTHERMQAPQRGLTRWGDDVLPAGEKYACGKKSRAEIPKRSFTHQQGIKDWSIVAFLPNNQQMLSCRPPGGWGSGEPSPRARHRREMARTGGRNRAAGGPREEGAGPGGGGRWPYAGSPRRPLEPVDPVGRGQGGGKDDTR